MAPQKGSNWRAAPAFNDIYLNLADCVAVAVKEFESRLATQFVITRHQINNTWAVCPWSEYRKLPNDHPSQPATICFFGNYGEFSTLCRSFPADLFTRTANEDHIPSKPETGTAADNALQEETTLLHEQAHDTPPPANPNDKNPENT